MRNYPVIKRDLRYLRIREHITEDVRLFYVIQNIHVLLYLKQVIAFIKSNRSVLESLKTLIVIAVHFV